jgi:hypothetical protein
MAQDSLGVVSNTGEATDASMKMMMGKFAIVLHHQALMMEIPLCVTNMAAETFVNIARMVQDAISSLHVVESFQECVEHMVAGNGVNSRKLG